MSKSKVYTKTGDSGETSLVSGTRVSKGSHRLHIYGEVDELNSYLGMGHSLMKLHKVAEEELIFIENLQARLFDLGSNLACEQENAQKFNLPQITDNIVIEIEEKIDELDSQLQPLKNFILPGGHPVASSFHIARTICRRIERNFVSFNEENANQLPTNAIVFINRLSDYLFIMARYANYVSKEAEVLWKTK